MEMADEFLHKPMLSLPAPGEGSSDKLGKSQMSFNSQMTSNTNKDFMALNRERAKNYNPYKKPMICEQLDETSRNRLDNLMKDIDDHLEDIIKEKEEYEKPDGDQSVFSKALTDANNAYLYSRDDMDKIEKINESLRKVTPMLPPSEDFET